MYVPDRKSVELLKKLQSARSLLVKMKTQLSNHLGEAKDFFDPKDYKILEKNLKKTVINVQVSVVNLEKQMNKVLCSDESLKQNAEIMESLPGVGRQTALRLITATNNFQTISDPKKGVHQKVWGNSRRRLDFIRFFERYYGSKFGINLSKFVLPIII